MNLNFRSNRNGINIANELVEINKSIILGSDDSGSHEMAKAKEALSSFETALRGARRRLSF